ncbi:MAG: hypothetical protein RLZZ454_1583 [Pseudomonadota bacterium]
MESLKDEISAVAARMVVEEGLDFGSAKQANGLNGPQCTAQ